MSDRPNILFILTDQMRGDCLGIAGHPVVETPHLDELARRGTLFTAAYSTCPSCIAARASIMTGLTPSSHGRLGYQDRVPWRYDDMLPALLGRAGYQTHCVGKTHFYPQRAHLGFDSLESYEAAQNFDGLYVNDYYEWVRERTGGRLHEDDARPDPQRLGRPPERAARGAAQQHLGGHARHRVPAPPRPHAPVLPQPLLPPPARPARPAAGILGHVRGARGAARARRRLGGRARRADRQRGRLARTPRRAPAGEGPPGLLRPDRPHRLPGRPRDARAGAAARRADGRPLHQRPRRDAGRPLPVPQDLRLRGLGAGADDRQPAGRARGPRLPRAGGAGGRLPDAPGGRRRARARRARRA